MSSPTSTSPGPRGRLQPRRGVHGVTESRVLHPAPGADRADDDGTGLDADTHAEPLHPPGVLDLAGVLGDLLDDPQRRAHRALGIVLVGRRGTEERQDAVAGEVLDRAAERLHGADHARHGVAHDDLELFRVHVFAERGRADQVGEDRRDHSPFFTHLAGVVERSPWAYSAGPVSP